MESGSNDTGVLSDTNNGVLSDTNNGVLSDTNNGVDAKNNDTNSVAKSEVLNVQRKENVKKVIYPFIDELVDTFYTDETNSLIENAVSSNGDKSVFLMFVMMYFGIHLKLDNSNDQVKKEQLKLMLSDIVKDHNKRQICIQMFHEKMQDIFNFNVENETKFLN